MPVCFSNDDKMLIDCHAHTSAVSTCCKCTAQEVIDHARSVGIDGIVITNHYAMAYITKKKIYPDAGAMARAHIEEYHSTKALGEKYAFEVLFGIELTMELYGGVHMLIYGISEQFVMNNINMAYYTQEELYRAVKAEGGVLVQAHPMRKGKNVLLDLTLLDGIEISSHILYDGTHYEELSDIAYRNGLILTSGGDFHGDTSRSLCGMYLPKDITDTKKLAAYLCSANEVHLRMQEAEGADSYEKIFVRGKGEIDG